LVFLFGKYIGHCYRVILMVFLRWSPLGIGIAVVEKIKYRGDGICTNHWHCGIVTLEETVLGFINTICPIKIMKI
jgi:hypothetical protein